MPIRDLIPTMRGRKEGSLSSEEWASPFQRLQREMNQLFDDFFRGSSVTPFSERCEGFSPCLDIKETDKEFILEAELPGLEEKDIDLQLAQHRLIISGEKKQEKEEKKDNYHRVERHFGRFRREIPLTEEVDTNKVSAEFKKGVLYVKLPKTGRALENRKHIEIKSA